MLQVREAAAQRHEDAKLANQPDDLIDFVQLKSKKGLTQLEIEDEVSQGKDRAKASHGGKAMARVARRPATVRAGLVFDKRSVRRGQGEGWPGSTATGALAFRQPEARVGVKAPPSVLFPSVVSHARCMTGRGCCAVGCMRHCVSASGPHSAGVV